MHAAQQSMSGGRPLALKMQNVSRSILKTLACYLMTVCFELKCLSFAARIFESLLSGLAGDGQTALKLCTQLTATDDMTNVTSRASCTVTAIALNASLSCHAGDHASQIRSFGTIRIY